MAKKIVITPRGFAKCGVYNADIIRNAGFDLEYNDTGLAYDVFPIDPAFVEKYEIECTTVEEILTKSDFVSLHVPLTAETKDFIGTEEFKKMKKNAVLINTARGGIVNERELYEALVNKEIKAAYFDVFSSEPPAKDEPLMTLKNFYLTPHIASRSAEAEKNTADIATRVIIEALS